MTLLQYRWTRKTSFPDQGSLTTFLEVILTAELTEAADRMFDANPISKIVVMVSF